MKWMVVMGTQDSASAEQNLISLFAFTPLVIRSDILNFLGFIIYILNRSLKLAIYVVSFVERRSNLKLSVVHLQPRPRTIDKSL